MDNKLDPVFALLRAQTTAVLATTGEDGLPRSTPLFYISDDDLRLYWFSSRTTLHSWNCALQPRVSISVSTAAHTWQQIQGLQMQGSVAIIPFGPRRKALTAAYVERFSLGNLFSLAIRSASLYCFEPAWLRYIDNTRRFGYKFEIDLKQEAR
jgi:uncharacterized protein YhbP (UPF0306 family)